MALPLQTRLLPRIRMERNPHRNPHGSRHRHLRYLLLKVRTKTLPKTPSPQEGEKDPAPHPLVEILNNYDNCSDDAVDTAAKLITKLVEIHTASRDDWYKWLQERGADWQDEVSKLLEPYETKKQTES